jgi:hypothetical protein
MLKIINGSPGFGAPLNEQETVDFLTTGKLNIHLGTIDEKGHPTWIYYETENSRIYIETSKQGKKTSNLRKNENLPYKGVRGKGSVNIHEDIDFNIPIAEKIMVKYLGSIEHPMAQALLNMQKGGQSVILEIDPIYYSTWDYSRQ